MIAIYPITPASPMGELADDWSAAGRTNIFGTVPQVIEMQSEAGAAGAVHGSLQAGADDDVHRVAGAAADDSEHVQDRGRIDADGLSRRSPFGGNARPVDFRRSQRCHGGRSTGWAMLASSSVQEAQDFAPIGQAATLESRIPFLHFFDGFRTSHELNKIEEFD